MAVKYGSLPFDEQIQFFRQKLNLPTRAWTDIWEGMHARAFVIAGATQDSLLTDFRTAVDKAISEGTTLAEFRKDFDKIVATHGWSYNGSRGWRSRTIYDTNLRTSYAAGRHAQMKAVATDRPYWRYRHNDSVEHPRPEHLAWNGLVLRHDDPWWQTHFPPNGWGCRCYVETLAGRDLQALGKDAPDNAPPLDLQMRTVGAKGPSARTIPVPKGIDPGFGYNVGEAAWGRGLSEQAMAQWRAAGADAWQSLDTRNYVSFDRADVVPRDATKTKLAAPVESPALAAKLLRELLGGEEKIYNMRGLPVLVNAETLARHVDANRSAYLPLIEEAINDPFEVWLTFERHKGTGIVALRTRAIKSFEIGRGRALLVVMQANKGMLEAWTAVPTSDLKYLNRQRRGWMFYGRKK